ncbi:MAG: fructose-6-phosphate aldolase [Caulobacterales bacterium]
MKIFLDTADTSELRELAATGLIDGVTTNPSLIAKSGKPILATLREICGIVAGPVSGEVVATEAPQMLIEAEVLSALAPNIVIKLPLTMEGLKACKVLSEKGVRTNVTLCFSATQALLAAKAGASFISPFIGRLDDNGHDGMALIREIRTIYDNYGFETEILAASIRTVGHMRDAALAGADCATLPAGVFRALYRHVLTDLGLEAFLKDWRATGQSIV